VLWLRLRFWVAVEKIMIYFWACSESIFRNAGGLRWRLEEHVRVFDRSHFSQGIETGLIPISWISLDAVFLINVVSGTLAK